MKIYNMCNKEEYALYRIDNPHIDIEAFEYFSRFLYYYADYACYAYRLDGPAFEYKKSGIKKFLINREFILEEDYWKHPDVIKYNYLKEHPELEAFI